MKLFNSFWSSISVACLVFSLYLGCTPSQHETPKTSTELNTDTRPLVKKAYQQVNIMVVRTNRNLERAQIIKNQMEKTDDPLQRLGLGQAYATELLKAGLIDDAIKVFEALDSYLVQNNFHPDSTGQRNLYSLMGIAYMRKGEIENCVAHHNHQSCFIPIAGSGVHQLEQGSRMAIQLYEKALIEFPDDLELRYLLNLAYMTLGEYPTHVPSKFRINPSWFKNEVTIKPFKDIAPQLGINRKGLAGGCVVDDFNNDGWLDIVATSWSPREELVLYINQGDGSFKDETQAYHLDGQVGCLNLNQTDFNNDGWLDLYLMRGAWYLSEGDIPNTLLMNTGKGYFEDVTIKAGLTHFTATQNSAWADFNLDGWLDLVIGNESHGEFQRGMDLYMNQKDGTFMQQAVPNGLKMNEYIKGCVATDINNDRYPDLFISTLFNGNHLFLNQFASNQGFAEIPNQAREPMHSFPCWSFDYDNDGQEDLFVSAFSNETSILQYWAESKLGKSRTEFLPKLYHNDGNLQFDDVSLSMGLNEVAFTMGCNFGDINTDGFLDFYLATGNPLYQSLVPNKMYLNMAGKRFEDVSYSGGFANIQKGHGVGFGDIDHDGDEDLYIVMGGAYDGDGFYNCLFENPNEHQYHWLVLKLQGTQANHAGIGARVEISVQENGKERKIFRTVTSGASFGANSLALEVGLRNATSVIAVKIQWPCRDCPEQIINGLEINKAYLLIQDQPAATLLTYTPVKMKGEMSHMHQ